MQETKDLPETGPHAPAGERRLFPRFPFHRRAVLWREGVQHDGILVDLSLSGALFRADAPLAAALEEDCRLDILNGGGRCCVRAQARIAHVHPDLVGVRFCQLDFGTMQGLMQIAEMNLGSPAMMKRELGALLRAPVGKRRGR